MKNMNKEQEFLTQEKKAELEHELEYRKSEKRKEILDRLAFAKSLGDLSENAEYHTSKDEQGKNEARISQIEFILKNAVVVSGSEDGSVALGSVVCVEHAERGSEHIYTIVGNEEADLAEGKIAFSSPIGEALMDKKKGDTVEVATPRGITRYIIKKVS